MKVKIVNPSLIELVDPSDNELELLNKKLSYVDKSKVLLWMRFKNNKYQATKLDPEDYKEQLDKLKKDTRVHLINNINGKYYTYIGLLPMIRNLVSDVELEGRIDYPEPQPMEWEQEPNEPRYYQREAYDLLILNKHGAVSVPTGGGKSLIISMLTKHYGLKTVIMVPTDSIATQLVLDLSKYLGKSKVGMYGGGKKDYTKQIVVGIDKSLLRIEEGSKEWEELSKAKVVMVDESHMVATSAQETVMLGVLKNAPYRFFFSATQFRNDGGDLLLTGITGQTVYEVNFRKLVNEGFLAKPKFVVIKDDTLYNPWPKDPLAALNKHFYKNKKIHRKVAELANKCFDQDLKVIIMIDRIEQFSLLLPYLSTEPKFAYGSLTKEHKQTIPKDYHGYDCQDLVDEFNDGKIPLLVATKAIGVGTDIRPVDVIFNLQGGKSDVKFMQLIGRGTRKVHNKKHFYFFDVHQKGHSIMNKWAESRQNLFDELSDDLTFI